MRVILHTDDIGITAHSCQDVLSAWRAGALDSFSVIVNGDAVEQLKVELNASEALPARIAVHLNLTEGPSSADPAKLDLLVNHEGRFRHSFGGLLKIALLGSRARRRRLVEQVGIECTAQIRAAKQICGDRPVTAIDGHNHVHMIPGLFRVMAHAAAAEGLSEIRLSKEPFYIVDLLRDPFRPFVWINLLKYFILRLFSHIAEPIVAAAGLSSPDRLIGILYTGQMTKKRALRGIAAAVAEKAEVIEVVFHVGRAVASEARRWRDIGGAYTRFHLSELRDVERAELLSLANDSIRPGNPDLFR